MRKVVLAITIALAPLFAVVVVIIPTAACIWDFSWDAPPPVYCVQITSGMIHTPGTDFPCLVVALIFGVPVMALCCWLLLITRPRRRTGLCRSCSYDLTGNVSGACPECGMFID